MTIKFSKFCRVANYVDGKRTVLEFKDGDKSSDLKRSTEDELIKAGYGELYIASLEKLLSAKDSKKQETSKKNNLQVVNVETKDIRTNPVPKDDKAKDVL